MTKTKRKYSVSLEVALSRLENLKSEFCNSFDKLIKNINIKDNINKNVTNKRPVGRPRKNVTNVINNDKPVINKRDKHTLQNIGKLIFIDVLKQSNKPLTTHEVFIRAKKLKLTKDNNLRGKRLYQTVQQAAFNLSKEHEVKRNQIDGKSFEYGLKEWNYNTVLKSA